MAARIYFAAFIATILCVPAPAADDIRFLPATPQASVEFMGTAQSGKETHRLEIRRLATVDAKSGELVPVWTNGGYYVIYTAGSHAGPAILGCLDGAIEPVVRITDSGNVEIFYLAGAHTHIRERWCLLGSSAVRQSREEIDWRDDPRMEGGTKK